MDLPLPTLSPGGPPDSGYPPLSPLFPSPGGPRLNSKERSGGGGHSSASRPTPISFPFQNVFVAASVLSPMSHGPSGRLTTPRSDAPHGNVGMDDDPTEHAYDNAADENAARS